jgi:hypothetical protein
MGKQAVFNMVAGVAIVAAPVAHIMSRYYCAVPPVSSPLPVRMRRALRESLATGSGGEFRATTWSVERDAAASLCPFLSLTVPLRPPRAAQSLNPRSPHVERRQARGKPERMAQQVPRPVAGIARPQELRCVRVMLSLLFSRARLVSQSLPQCAAATADPYAQECQTMCPLLNTNKLQNMCP